MDSSALKSTRIGLLAGRSPLLRLQSDERLIALIRSGNEGAFELLFERYRARLLSFCRHMLGSKEDAEDVLQELFAAAYGAIRADDRAINARPWLYRIARNRCLNHLRRPRHEGQDTMDDRVHAGGTSTADIVHKRADFRHLLKDVRKLPETQRTALLLREIDALSYEQISESMQTTVPSVKSLLVRARMSLAEAAESRKLTCNDARRELAEVAEGLKKTTPPVRRHLRDCDQCAIYRTQLRKTSATMAMVFPVGLIAVFKKLVLVKLGTAAAAGGGSAATGGAAAGGIAAGTGGTAAGTALPFGLSAVAGKAIAATAATALLAGGAVEVKKQVTQPPHKPGPAAVQAQPSAPQSGGQSVDTLPPVPLAKKKLEELSGSQAPPKAEGKTGEELPAGSGSPDEAGAGEPTGQDDLAPTPGDPSAPTGQDDISPVGEQAPAQGQSDTGGATLPPGQGQPPAK